MQHLTD
jgi:hypothetical protein